MGLDIIGKIDNEIRDVNDRIKQFRITHAVGSAGRNPITSAIVSNHEMASRSIVAWNLFRRARTATIRRYFPKKPIPKAI